MKLIPLSQGLFSMIDDADFEAVNVYKWCAHKKRRGFYAVRNIRLADGSRATQGLHRFLISGIPQIDHEDGNGLNNQRFNLRSATTRQNAQGFQRKHSVASSRFRGVLWDSFQKKWRARITANGKQTCLGRFESEIDAALAYDAAAQKYFGDFASPNFP